MKALTIGIVLLASLALVIKLNPFSCSEDDLKPGDRFTGAGDAVSGGKV